MQALGSKGANEKNEADELLGTGEDKITSEVFLLELSAAFSRRDDLISALASEVEASSGAIVMAYVTYVMSKLGLKFIEPSGEKVVIPMGRASAEVSAAVANSGDLKMRSLDLLHIAHLRLLKEKGYPVESIATCDRDFLKAEKFLDGIGVKVSIANLSRQP